MKILVTGCFGFIGYNFVSFLKNKYGKDVKIYGIDSLTNNFSKINAKNTKDLEFFKADINNISKIESKNIKKIDVIVNFAAESHVDTSIYKPNVFLKSNILGLSELMKFSIDNNIEEFIHVSTDEVYGSYERSFAKEDDYLNPSSASKASAELIANSFSKTFDYKIKIVRPANNYGFFQQPEKLIPFSIANLVFGNNIEIYGNGEHIRHWLHVDDTCSGIDSVLNKGKKGEVYNIGSGVYLNNSDIAKKILSYLNLGQERMIFVKDRPGHDFRYAVNFDKLKQLGWKPNENFDDLLGETIDWYISNENWWKKGFNKILKDRIKRFSLNE